MQDETKALLSSCLFAPGPDAKRVVKAKAAKSPLPPTLEALRQKILKDPTMGYISNAVAFSRIVYGASERSGFARLLKGGHLRILLVEGPPPPDSNAARETRSWHPDGVYSDSRRYYRIESA